VIDIYIVSLTTHPKVVVFYFCHKWELMYSRGIQRVGRVTQVVEHLPSKCEAMSSTPSTTKKGGAVGGSGHPR
jgi:hypothetical protein